MLTPGESDGAGIGCPPVSLFQPQAPGRGRVESRLTEVLMSNSRIRSFVAAAACVAVVALAAGQTALKYPQTRKGDQVDSYGGITVQDPVPVARGPRYPGGCGVGLGTERRDVRLSVEAADARRLQGAHHQPLRLSANDASGAGIGPHLLSPELGPRAAIAALRAHRSCGCAGENPRSELVVGRRVDLARRLRPGPRRKAAGLHHLRRGRRLADGARPRPGGRQGPLRRGEMDAVLRPVVDEGREGLLLLSLP